MNERERNERIERLWYEADAHRPGTEANRLALGEIFSQLRELYSDRNSGGHRLTSGHGTFEEEIRARGYSPRTVRGWIKDREAAARGEASSSDKRRAQRARQKRAVTPDDAVTAFARLLSLKALQAAYRAEALARHPDRGGSTEGMQALNEAWTRVQKHFSGSVVDIGDFRVDPDIVSDFREIFRHMNRGQYV